MARQMMNAGLQPALALLLAMLMYWLGLSWGAFVLCNETRWHWWKVLSCGFQRHCHFHQWEINFFLPGWMEDFYFIC